MVDRETKIKLIDEIIEKCNKYDIPIDEKDDVKLDIFKSLELQLEYHRANRNSEDKKIILKEIEELYYKNYSEVILCILAKLQANLGVEDNIIFDDSAIRNVTAGIYRIRGDIYRNLIKRQNNDLSKETKLMYKNLCIENYEKGLELEEDNYKLRHALAHLLIIKANINNIELLDEAANHLEILLHKFEADSDKYIKEKFICYQLLAEAYRKKCEYTRYESFKVWEENAKNLIYYLDLMDEYKINKNTKKKYYKNKEKLCMELVVGYSRYRYNEMAKLYLNEIIQRYHDNVALLNPKKNDMLIRALATKARILQYEKNNVLAKENLEMSLNLEAYSAKSKSYTNEVMEKCKGFVRYTEKKEEGTILSINEEEKYLIINCKTCGEKHLAYFSSFNKKYTMSEFKKIKEDKNILEYTVLRSFKYPLNDEAPKDACFINVTEKRNLFSLQDSLEEAELENNKTELKVKENEKSKEDYVLNLVEEDCIGYISFNPCRDKGYTYNKNLDVEYPYVLSDIESTIEIENLRPELCAYESSRSYVKFDIYESLDPNTEKVVQVARNIRLLLS